MVGKPIIVAVDDSPESSAAAALGWSLAQTTDASCEFVHVVQDPLTALAALLSRTPKADLETILLELIGPRLRAALGSVLPEAALAQLAIRVGRTAFMLKLEAAKRGAGLVILGGKPHPLLGRWAGGSTALDAVRTLGVPVLVTRGAQTVPRRILVGVDLSYAAEPAIREAERFAALTDGALRAVHVVEPVSRIPEIAPVFGQEQLRSSALAALKRGVWPLVRFPHAERTVRSGDAAQALAAEAAEWRADLLVVGSHGKGWVERLLLGTVTEQLINALPVALLVVPVRTPTGLTARLARGDAHAQPVAAAARTSHGGA